MSYLGIKNEKEFLEHYPDAVCLGETPSLSGVLYRTPAHTWCFSVIDGHLTVVHARNGEDILFACKCVEEIFRRLSYIRKDLEVD